MHSLHPSQPVTREGSDSVPGLEGVDPTQSPRPPGDLIREHQDRPPLPQAAPMVLMTEETLMNLAADSLPLMNLEQQQDAKLKAVKTAD
jgi:hypothetical protein